MERSKRSLLSWLEPDSVRASIKEGNQKATTLTDNKKERLRKRRIYNCIGINYAHMFPKCFKSLHTLLGFALYLVSSIFNYCRCNRLLNFDLYANSL